MQETIAVEQIAGIGQPIHDTPRDREQWTQLRALIHDYPPAFTRDTARGGHVTGSVFLLSQDQKNVLLTHHRKLDRWLQLGGHCDGIADVRFAAMKEAYEESGLARITLLSPDVFDIDIHEIPARGEDPAHLHYDVRYLMRAEAGEIRVSPESKALSWIALDGLEAVTQEPSIIRMRNRARDFLAKS